jgi:hypothetical protein
MVVAPMSKSILAIIAALMFIAMPSFAAESPTTNQTCASNDTMTLTDSIYFCEQTTCRTFLISENVTCEFGCDMETNQCEASPLIGIGFVAAILLAFVGIIWWVRK